jgi:3-oxoacyl-[acyl-carrier protein] reductase
MYKFKNKTVIITGGGTGIGYTIAESFLESGANIVIVGRRQTILDKAIASIKSVHSSLAGNIIAIKCDASQEAEVNDMFDKVIKRFSTIDILINSCGTWLIKSISKINSAEIDEQYNNLYKTTILCTKYAALHMNDGGVIINIGSFAGIMGIRDSSIYSSLKTAINAFTKSSAFELGKNGIRVNCIIPGVIRTDMTSDYIDANTQKLLKPIALGRFGESADIANSVLFLASDYSSYITGSILEITGGKYISQL